jgi:LysM domain
MTTTMLSKSMLSKSMLTKPMLAKPMLTTTFAGTTIDPMSGRRERVVRRPISSDTYRRRRAFVGTVLAAFVACGIVLTHDVLAGSGGVPASAAASQPALVRATITAQPGDSLWSIAQSHRGTVSINTYIDKLVSLNGGPSIQAGQQVVLP